MQDSIDANVRVAGDAVLEGSLSREKAVTAFGLAQRQARDLDELLALDEMLISETGYSHGWGSAPWKTVHGLTSKERMHARTGGIVVITECPLSGGGNGTGTMLRQVHVHGTRLHHRVPSDLILERYRVLLAL